MSLTLMSLFIPTFFFVSITPGMGMILALTLGMSIGVRQTMYMMLGELIGVAIVAISAALGVAALMLQLPQAFIVLKLVGGSYLIWLGYQMWCSRGKLVLSDSTGQRPPTAPKQLAINGFVTAIANPKAWAFFITLLPSFLITEQPLAAQLSVMIAIILCLEFSCLMLYASGGQALRHLLLNKNNVKLLNRISGTLMIAVGCWLALS
ncbi:MAG: LysE family translocator [Oceanospirillaceae bacterium]|nr:LysE family translocator [Oceanospirillaceae bacterium]